MDEVVRIPERRPIEKAWRRLGEMEGAELIGREIAHQGYLGVSPFKHANYDPIRAAVIEGRQQLASILLAAVEQEFIRADMPVPAWLLQLKLARNNEERQ